MATETNERVICVLSVASMPENTASTPWTPPALTASPARSPLSMRFETKARKARNEEEAKRYVPEKDMVFIPSDEFLMGDNEGARDEKPQRAVLLSPYWIDRYPVTNAEYKDFVDATGHRRPPHWASGTYALEQADHPVTNVSWNDANAYANWVGKRLPTEAEWEKASRGTQGQTYPWGDAFRKDNVNSSSDYKGTTPVKQFHGGASPYGVMDMCGNTQEWCLDWYYDDYYKTAPFSSPTGPEGGQYRVCRGGFYAENRAGVRCAARHYAPPSTMQDHIGFRCAKTPRLPAEKPAESKVETQASAPKVEAQAPKTEPVKRLELSEDMSLDAIASEFPERVAKVVRAILHEAGDGDKKGVQKQLAVLMVGLGQTTGAEVMKYLTDLEIETIAQAVTECNRVTPQEKREVFEDIESRVFSEDHALFGGAEFARSTLEKALGPRKAQALLGRVSSAQTSGFHLLRNVSPNQIVSFISKEHPQTIALILSQLDAKQAGGVINGLSEELQVDVANRIGDMNNISPQVLRELEEGLANNLKMILSGQITEVGGPKAVAEILNRTGRTTEKAVLEALDKSNPDLAEMIRNQMFVFDDIANLTDLEIQRVLQEVDPRDLAVGLKGGSEELKDRIFKNVSEEVADKIKEEMQYSGPVRMSDVEEVQLRIVQTVRQLEEADQVTIERGDSTDIFI